MQRRIRHGIGQDIDVAVECSLFEMIVKPRRDVDLAIDIEVDWAMSDRIPCNGAVKLLAYWQLRMFGLSGLVYRPSDLMSICIIPLRGFKDRRFCYTLPFGLYLHFCGFMS